MTKYWFWLAVILKLPSKSDVTPIVVPLIIIVAPASGAFVSFSKTIPETSKLCAERQIVKIEMDKVNSFFK